MRVAILGGSGVLHAALSASLVRHGVIVCDIEATPGPSFEDLMMQLALPHKEFYVPLCDLDEYTMCPSEFIVNNAAPSFIFITLLLACYVEQHEYG